MTTEQAPAWPTEPGSRQWAMASLTNFAPGSDAVINRAEQLRDAAKDYMAAIYNLCPDTIERETAVGELLDSCMWAVKAIMLNQELPYEWSVYIEPQLDIDQIQAADNVAFHAEQVDGVGVQSAPGRYVDPELAFKLVAQASGTGTPLDKLIADYVKVRTALEAG